MNITFPRLADYDAAIERLLRRAFPHDRITVPPKMTKRTMELGSRVSPDGVCAPFKHNMGNFIEALELGADTIFQTGTGCRAGYYGVVQERILRDAGYNFNFVNISRENARPDNIYKAFCELGSPLSFADFLYELALTVSCVMLMDKFAYGLRKNAAFELERGAYPVAYEQLLRGVRGADTFAAINKLRRECEAALRGIEINTPKNPLRIGVVGDLYTLMEPFSNFYIEDELIRNGISVSRQMSVSFLLFGHAGNGRSRYLQHRNIGATASSSVTQCERYARLNYDGVIHMKSSGCTPEINAMPVIAKLARDYSLPVLTLSFDSALSEVGVQTRLEAFIDMIRYRKEREAYGAAWGGHRLHIN